MKYLKILGLAAIATGALMAFIGAGTASATQLTCKNASGIIEVCPKGTLIKAASEGHAILDNSATGNIECNSTLEGSTSNTGSATETIKGVINFGGLTFTNCTSAVVQVLSFGTLEIHTEYTKEADGHETQNTASTNNGTLTSTGAEWTVEKAGFHCIYSTSATDLGTVTGSTTTKGKATLDINGRIPRTGGRSGIFCGESAPLTGSYVVNSPEWLDVD
ncbi:MAG TPA: hypothetical protein VFX44_06905 [Solirubrobacterales bacterium]|nr:hypothetical protein [Solirubrobacterales bacterium]